MAGQSKTGSERELNNQRHSVLRLFINLSLAIFAVETGIMLLFLHVSPNQLTVAETFGDGVLLALGLSPVLYFLVIRPFLQQFAERYRIVAALRESEERYRSIFENSMVGIFRSVPEGRFITVNPALALMLGYDSAEEMLALSLPADLYVDHSQRYRLKEQLEIFGVCEDHELCWKTKTGQMIMVSVHARTFYGEVGTIAYFEGMVLDISKRKHAEQELRDACQRLQERKVFVESIMANIQSGLIVTDPGQRVILVNPYVLKLLGKGAGEVADVSLAEFCPELDREIAAGASGAEIQVSSGGHDHTIGFHCSDMKRGDGSPAGQIIAFKDLTEVMKIRRELKLKERLAAIGEVVARVAHEVRNPLFGVTAAAQILAMELELTPPQKELMESLLSEARRLNNLVEELLDCSKEMKLNAVIFDLVKTVNESIGANEVFVLEKRLTVERSLPHGELTLVADPEKIKQVLLNLVKNAVDATPPGGTITVAAVEGPGEVAVRVTDSGPGIPEDAMEKIFDVFYTTKKHGTGLGLSISKRIVDAHGGALTAANDAGGGATFTVALPLTPGDR